MSVGLVNFRRRATGHYVWGTWEVFHVNSRWLLTRNREVVMDFPTKMAAESWLFDQVMLMNHQRREREQRRTEAPEAIRQFMRQFALTPKYRQRTGVAP